MAAAEILFAQRIARAVLFFFIAIFIFLGGLKVVEKTLAVPSLSPKLFKERVELEWVKIPPKKEIIHVVEKSEIKIEIPKEEIKKLEIKKPILKPAKPKPKIKKEIKKEPPPEIIETAENPVEEKGEVELPQKKFQGNVADLKNQSLALIIQIIEKNKHYPRRARQMGLTGKVVLKISILNGIIQNISIAQENNAQMLNSAAMSAAEKLKGKSVPLKTDFVVNVPVEFSLND